MTLDTFVSRGSASPAKAGMDKIVHERKRVPILGVCLFLIIMLLGPNIGFSQVKEEKEEKALEETDLLRKPSSYNLSSRLRIMSGYDSNANLGPLRKGDIFEEALFSLDFNKHWIEDIKFTFDYDLDVSNYNEFTDLSNILDHFRFGLHKKLPLFSVGTGYDLSILYYPNNEDDNFLFHKGFLYVRQDISKKTYHQLQFESGIKDYTKKKALDDTINTYQDKERLDRRLSIDYSLVALLNRRLLSRLKTKFSVNDSNARYLKFYDYKSYQESLNFDYKLLKDLYLLSSFTYTRKNYTGRTVTNGNYKQKDNLYAATLGMMYKLDKHNSLSLSYTYRENSSNDFLAEYSQGVITCGWQYNF